MPANIIRVVERMFDHSSAELFGCVARLEVRVEFVKTGRNGTLVRIIRGPCDGAVAHPHSQGWERELTRLQA